jgi:hypothetical protein
MFCYSVQKASMVMLQLHLICSEYELLLPYQGQNIGLDNMIYISMDFREKVLECPEDAIY